MCCGGGAVQISRNSINKVLEAGDEDDGTFSLRMQQHQSLRSLVASGRPESMDQYTRIFKVLDVCHEQLLNGGWAPPLS